MVALVGNAPTSRALQARANLSQLWGQIWRARPVLPRFYLLIDNQASMLFDLTRMVARQGDAPCSTA